MALDEQGDQVDVFVSCCAYGVGVSFGDGWIVDGAQDAVAVLHHRRECIFGKFEVFSERLEDNLTTVFEGTVEREGFVFERWDLFGPDVIWVPFFELMSFGDFLTDVPKLFEIGVFTVFCVLATKRSVTSCATGNTVVFLFGLLVECEEILEPFVGILDGIFFRCRGLLLSRNRTL